MYANAFLEKDTYWEDAMNRVSTKDTYWKDAMNLVFKKIPVDKTR